MATSAQVSTTVTIPPPQDESTSSIWPLPPQSQLQSHSPTPSTSSTQPRQPSSSPSSAGYRSAGPLNRPWWRPPARNYRPHPANRVLATTYSLNSIVIPVGPHESLPHYWFRAMNYILRIPFREMVGNVTRPYDPTGPQPLADIPMSIPPPTRLSPPAQAGGTGVSGPGTTSGTTSGTEARGRRTLFSLWSSSPASTQGQPEYMPQVRKAWAERTGDIGMALMAAFFSSTIVTVIAITALALNWSKECTYLKVYMVVFVVRKWIMAAIMIDRALYRLPLNLVEGDPDIDEERYNGIAIYMSDLFTWHGYAMLFAGSFYVYGYATVHYLGSAPVITGVALVFASMGLVPFFTLLTLIFIALSCLYVLYILFICFIWPFEKCGLSRRRAISRRNGGYRSDGTTNTTDLAQLGNSSSVIGFGNCDNIKVTPAMAAIPIVVFRKPVKTVAPSEKADDPTTGRNVMEKMVDIPTTASSSASKGVTTNPDSQTDAISKMPTSLSRLCSSITGSMASPTSSPSMSSAASCVGLPPPCIMSSQHGSRASSTTSFVPATGSEEGTEKYHQPGTTATRTNKDKVRGCHRLSHSISSQSDHVVINMGHNAGVGRICDSPEIETPKPERRGSSGVAAILPYYLTTTPPVPPVPSIGSSSAPISPSTPIPQGNSRPPSPWVPATTTTTTTATRPFFSSSQDDSIVPVLPIETYPQVWATNYDDECAICLNDFIDGDELRQMYCDHYFHRNCVDRWLVRNPFCPKCKRAI
ncbi:E3 ubiquitin-protein ligase rnf13 [Mortierella antarctica]|nr:E3 ubiquitin-protein ligase rnf13 [Mortierella antarctica]